MISAVVCFNTLPILPTILDKIAPINGSWPKIFILDGEYLVDRHQNYGKIFLFEGSVTFMTTIMFCTVDTTYTALIQQCVGIMNVVQ